MKNYPTAHINAKPGDIAKTIIMPGDPLRAQYIAETFLDDAKLFNNVRGVQGYTGKYKRHTVSVMAHGMGMPSMALYAHELYDVYGVKNIIRIGTLGALQKEIKTMDIVLVSKAATDSAMAWPMGFNDRNTPSASKALLEKARVLSRTLNPDTTVREGKIMTSDFFYHPNAGINQKLSDDGFLALDMETAALYMEAARFNRNALCIGTVSNNIITGEELSSMIRVTGVTNMITLALELATTL